MRVLLCMLLIWLCGWPCLASIYGTKKGYVADLQEEEEEARTREILLLNPPLEGRPEQVEMYDDKLRKEISDRYADEFGYTEYERNIDYLNVNFENQTVRELEAETLEFFDRQQRFAEYVVRKTTERKIEDRLKKDPDLKKIKDVKDRVSSYSVSPFQGYKFKAKYDLGGSNFRFDVQTPYFHSDFVFTSREARLGIYRQLNPRWLLSHFTKFEDGVMQVVGTRRLSPALSWSLTGSSFFKDEGYTVREHLFLTGINYIY